MVLHLGGTFGDKEATMLRFKENYLKLPPNIKKRLVLENDDVAWSAHDLLPLCEELNIPLVLDFHHNNIIFDSSQIREGTKDITDLYPRIKATWERKHMTWKMHYSEPTNDAITGRQRRCHNRRPSTLPPCPNDMDLMIEAKDKEQAVFDLMRNFKLPGWDSFNNIIPYERDDDNRPAPKKPKKKKTKKQIKEEIGEFGKELSPTPEEERSIIPEEEVGMGGPLNRVYWPEGMDEWLRPKKREVKKKIDEDDLSVPTPYNFPARLALKKKKMAPLEDEARQKLVEAKNIADMETLLEELKAPPAPGEEEQDEENVPIVKKTPPRKKASMKKGKAKFPARKRKRAQAPSDEDGESLTEELGLDYDDADVDPNLEQRSRKRS
jgi:UV DNA damage endonuclease